MQNSLEHKFSKLISKRNSRSYPIERSRFWFFVLFMIGGLLGAVLCYWGANNTTDQANIILLRHIRDICSTSSNFSKLSIEIIKLSKTDLCHVFFIFISGFTYFCFFVTGVIVFAKGFMFGFSLIYLSSAVNMINTPKFGMIYFILKLTICIITTILAAETYVFSYEFRTIKQNCSILRRAAVTYKFAFIFVKALGGCLLSNLIYCALIKLFN